MSFGPCGLVLGEPFPRYHFKLKSQHLRWLKNLVGLCGTGVWDEVYRTKISHTINTYSYEFHINLCPQICPHKNDVAHFLEVFGLAKSIFC